MHSSGRLPGAAWRGHAGGASPAAGAPDGPAQPKRCLAAAAGLPARSFVSGIGSANDAVSVTGKLGDTSIHIPILSDIRTVFASTAKNLRRFKAFVTFTVNVRQGAPAALTEFRRQPFVVKGSSITFTAADGSEWACAALTRAAFFASLGPCAAPCTMHAPCFVLNAPCMSPMQPYTHRVESFGVGPMCMQIPPSCAPRCCADSPNSDMALLSNVAPRAVRGFVFSITTVSLSFQRSCTGWAGVW